MTKGNFVSSRFGDLVAPQSLSELLDLVTVPTSDDENLVRMWRGQADIEWRIDSAAYRRLKTENTNPTDKNMAFYEEGLLKRATHRGFRVNNGLLLGDLDLLARLQHHGAATRLVDATRSALVGLFFACNSHPTQTGVLLGFHADFLGGYEGEPHTKDYKSTIRHLTMFHHPQTWEPPLVSPRIAAQHSQFLYSAICDSKVGSLFISPEQKSFIGIALKPEMKQRFLRILSETFDIRTETMFPDLDGFGTANRFDVPTSNSFRW